MSRINIWIDWLAPGAIECHDSFEQFTFSEVASQRPCIESVLSDLVSEGHKSEPIAIDTLRSLGFPNLADVWKESLGQPPAATTKHQSVFGPESVAKDSELYTRRGNLCEILLSDFSEQLLAFTSPIRRLRFNPNPNQSMKGDDVLAFQKLADDTISRVLVGESKFRANNSNLLAAIPEAIESLRQGPKSMDFVAAMLDLNGDHSSAQRVRQARARLENKSDDIQYHTLLGLFVKGSTKGVSDKIKEQLPLDNLTVLIVQFEPGIEEWFNTVFGD